MYKSTKAGLVALAAILLSNVGVNAANTDDANRGTNLYLHGRYEEAMPYLERACSNKGSAQVHYYLADTYYRLGKTADALSEYNLSLQLEPRGSVSGYCQQMVRTLQTYNPGKPDVKDPSKLPQYNKDVKVTDGSQPSGKVTLPPIPEPPSITPMTEVRLWDYLQRVRFTAQATEQVNKAQVHLKTTQELQKQSRKLATKALIPAKRAWGETQAEWKARVAKGGYKEQYATNPYDEAVTKAQALLAEAKKVQAACQRAGSGAEGPVPTTLVPYNGDEWSSGTNPFAAGSP